MSKRFDTVKKLIKQGLAIPASPLALDEKKQLDIPHLKALYRYYAAAGAGGIAVGVHSTQFEIREPEFALFEPVLSIAAQEMGILETRYQKTLVKIAGICGNTDQALKEASYAVGQGYDVGLLSLAALKDQTEEALIAHCKSVSEVIPIIGFYLQPSVGGRELSYQFWRSFCEIEKVLAIKVAPFNRYKTLDVVRAVADSGRENDLVLYTGNDDNIIMDLLTPFQVLSGNQWKTIHFRGGLLGQWCVWTKTAVEILDRIKEIVSCQTEVHFDLFTLSAQLTDANSAIFDAANGFRGCIAGINEVLRRQGLMATNLCLKDHERLSPGQSEEIDRVCRSYPWLTDDFFVHTHLEEWLKG